MILGVNHCVHIHRLWSNPKITWHLANVVVADERNLPVEFEVQYTKLFIDNQFVDAENGETFATLNPATEEEIAQIARGSKADVDKAVKAAQRAFEIGSEWRTMDASLRGELL
jgi:hypothetical protein